FLLRRRPRPLSPLFPYTTLFRSCSLASCARLETRTASGHETGAPRLVGGAGRGNGFGIQELARAGGQELVGSVAAEGLRVSVLRSEEHTSELQSRSDLVCRLLLE